MPNSDAPPIAVIAGNGRLPLEVAAALKAQGKSVFVCGIKGEADERLARYEYESLDWGQIGRLFKHLEQRNVSQVVFAGGVVGRPEIKITKMDWGTFRTLSGLAGALLAGDNEILNGVISVFEKRGLEVCNIVELLPELAAKPGNNSQLKPKRADLDRIEEGHKVIYALGKHDVGQACVVVGTRAVAVEGVEGTDGMLKRVADLRVAGRLPKRRGGILVKAVKPGQNQRADLPTIGPETVQAAHDAGLSGIGILANKSLIVERERTRKLADELGLFIYGFEGYADEQT